MNIISKLKQRIRNLYPPFKFQKISYSQCGEDIIVKFIFDSIGIQTPTYIDIGAHHPHYINNTAIFYNHGSTGINIEPDPSLFKNFVKLRKRDININVGVGSKEGLLDFYVMSSPSLNSFSKKDVESAKKEGYEILAIKKINVLSLNRIIKESANGVFPDFLSLDVEGFDLDILRSIDYIQSAPLIICVETISFSKNGNGVKDMEIADFLEGQGYMVFADTYINTIFVKRDKWRNRSNSE